MSGKQQELPVLSGPTIERKVPFGLAGLIREQTVAAPGATALVDAAGSLTYAELEHASDLVARSLAAAGAAPGDVVAVCLPRGTDMVVALLGALKAGTPYVPLSLDDPPDRRAAVVSGSRARIGLVTGDARGLLTETGLTQVLAVDELALEPDAHALAPLPERSDDHPAYVLFTSGSTGTPKGVVVPSLALCNRLLWMCEEYGFSPTDRILQKTPYTFDVSGWEFWAPLISGGQLVLLPPDAHRDPAEAIDWIVRHQVTICHFVPSMLDEFVRWPGVERCSSLRAVMCSGEALTVGQVRRFQNHLPRAELHNLYGPTEAAIDVSFWRCPPPGERLDRVLIGRPIANCTLLVVNEDLSPVLGDGVGQLAIGGQPLATGYLGSPDLTASAFVAAPDWSPVPRLYLTGDLVRRRGRDLEYLGRCDQQVKIRGQRVELGETEDALKDVPWVRDAAVVAVRPMEDTQLIAFVVPDGHTPPPAEVRTELDRLLGAKLPLAFLPAEYHVLDAIPLTSSGKTDRAELVRRHSAESPAIQGPTSTDELTQCWIDAVGFPPDRPDIGFLQAGGHSLAAVRLACSVLRRWGIRVPLTAFLREDLSLIGLRSLLPETAPLPVSPLSRRVDVGRARLSPEQRRLWLHQRVFPKVPAYNVVGVLDCAGALDEAALRRAWSSLIERYEVLRTTIDDADGQPCQRIHPMDRLPDTTGELHIGRASGTSSVPHDNVHWAEAVENFTCRLADTVFPATVPTRALMGLLVDTDRRRSALVLVIDHLVSDQRSLDLLWQALAERYAVEAGLAAAPHGEPIQYGDVLEAEADELSRRERDLEYWRTNLADASPELALPFRAHRPERPSFRGAAVEEELGAELTALLQRLGRANRVGPTIPVLACFARVLADWSGQHEVTIGVPVSGRETEQSQDAVGFFMRTLPVRLGMPADTCPDQLLEPVADALLTAIEHGSVPFDQIVQALGASRNLAGNPLFQVWFNDLTQAAPPQSFGGHEAVALAPPVHWSLFDLGLYVHQGEDGGYRLQLVYATDLWQEESARALLRQCVLELRGMTLVPDPPTTHQPSPFLPAVARLETCTDLVRRITDGADQHPDRPAIVTGGGSTNFAELADLVRKAATVVRRVVAPGAVVAVRAERHSDLPVAILGAWCAGNPVLLLDAATPEAWTESALAAARAELVLALDGSGTVTGWAPTATLDRTLLASAEPWSGKPESIPVGALGHALVTSGTTGNPAVVALPAEALPEALDSYAADLGLSAADRFCFTVPPAHDPVFRDLVLPLTLGASVRVPSPAEDRQPQALLDLLAQSRTTVWHTTPARARIIAAVAERAGLLPDVRLVVFHGERLTEADAGMVARLCPGAQLHNLYGTTETPQASGVASWSAEHTGSSVPIAGNVAHRLLSVRAPRGKEAAVGVVGELVVTGRGLALGYLGTPARRGASRLAVGRFGEAVSVFKTGDLARRLHDGRIEILGRKDRQVPVQGYRVELIGVERALAAVEGVRACVVATETADGGDLVAWFTAARPLPAQVLRAELRTQLPRWALPVRFVQVDELPVTRNGKLDLGALRAHHSATPARRTKEAPSELAELIAARASALAGEMAADSTEAERGECPQVHADTEFFRAGLGSLDLLQLHRLLAVEDGVRFPLAYAFRFPTPRRLAERIAAVEEPGPQPPVLRRKPSEGGELAARRAARARLNT